MSSSGGNPAMRDAPDGTIDPWLKTLSFWDGDRPVAALSLYATHPMSHYGKGFVSSDFPGLARRHRQADDPTVVQVYASGASGNVTAGRYNDGSPANRAVLADRLHRAMVEAGKSTRRVPLKQVGFRSVPLRLEPRESGGYALADLKEVLSHSDPMRQCRAALGLSWRKRADAGHRLDLPVVDFGPAQLVLLPGESYVEYQLHAQHLRPDSFVAVMGYGECAPGYVPIDQAWAEHDGNLTSWCWVAPGAEKAMRAALAAALT
jgi:hypothetical protein